MTNIVFTGACIPFAHSSRSIWRSESMPGCYLTSMAWKRSSVRSRPGPPIKTG
jgi:hypothetical protein